MKANFYSDDNYYTVELPTDPLYQDIEQWSLVACRECGLFVHDLDKHTKWHKNERLARAGAS